MFPTPRLSVLTVDTDNAAWGASGPPQRPQTQRYKVVLKGLRPFLRLVVIDVANHFTETKKIEVKYSIGNID